MSSGFVVISATGWPLFSDNEKNLNGIFQRVAALARSMVFF